MVKNDGTSTPEVNAGRPAGTKGTRAIFVISALDMSWRLAIAVLVPIIGGYELDKHLHSSPALTIIGFVLAMIGLFYILKRALAAADDKFNARTKQ